MVFLHFDWDPEEPWPTRALSIPEIKTLPKTIIKFTDVYVKHL